MSLQELLREQQSIVAEQQSMRAEFQRMQRKLDDFIKSELQRLSSRLDATDVRIQRLISGEAPANPKQFVESARGLFKSEDLNSQTSEPPRDPGPMRFAPRAAKAAARRGAAPAPAAPRLPMSRRGSAPALQTGSVWKTAPDHLEGLYLNGAEGKSVDSFKEWLTTQMFGTTTTGGSEIAYNLQAYKSKQCFLGFLESLGLPIAPKPAIVLVDQFEELLKRFPVQALDWANTLTNNKHTRDNLARVIFVCNSDAGSQTLLNLNQGTRFDRVIMEPVSGEDVMDLDKELFQKCNGNIGMYKLVENRIGRQELTKEQVVDFVRKTFQRWKLDFHLPYPVKYDRSWAELDVELMKERMEESLEQALGAKEKDGKKVFTEGKINSQMGFAKRIWEYLNQQQILDAAEELWREMLEGAGAEPAVALALASQIKGMICSPVPTR
eukprot:s592_g18.t1